MPSSFADVSLHAAGVVLALCGIGLLAMGVIALADREWRHGGVAVLIALAMLGAGAWLTGVIG
jgi:hypothetical protein